MKMEKKEKNPLIKNFSSIPQQQPNKQCISLTLWDEMNKIAF